MARKSNSNVKKSTDFSIYILVDGECEQDYLNSIKTHSNYIAEFKSNQVTINPKIPKSKSLEKQFEDICNALDGAYNRIIWIIDYDVIYNQSSKQNSGNEKSCDKLQRFVQSLRKKANQKKYLDKDIHLLINNPSIEFWYLLHFKQSNKFYSNSASVETELKKYLKSYAKDNERYRKQIFSLLYDKLSDAIDNAKLIKIDDSDIKARADIYKLFENDLKLLKK